MSANQTYLDYADDANLTMEARFRCDIPIPDYLLAIAVGDLVYRSTGDRTGVITEPSMID